MSAILDYDTGPLNWVRGDIDAALQAALGRIQAYSVDADLTNALRLAGDDAHQVTGALRMVGLEGAATLAGAIEASLADVNENRLTPTDELLRAQRNAMEGLQRWVKDLADGRGSGELALFPLYKRLRELQGAERVFEGELFFPDLRSRARGKPTTEGLSQEALAAAVKTARAQFQRGLLAFLRNVQAEQGLSRMRDALSAIERIAPSQASQTFWWACGGFVDSLIAHGVEADFHVKQLLARVDLQMRRLMEGSPQVAERLMRDALFFVAKSDALEGRAAEIRSTFGLDRYLPGRGMLDPEALARMRPVLDALQTGLKGARDHWHAFVDGQADQLPQFQAQLTRMHPQAQMLESSGLLPLLQQLDAAALAAQTGEADARDRLTLEVASTLLFMQNAVNQEDVLHADFAARAQGQQARLLALIEGREMPAPVDETTTQRESERDMLVHMAQEVGQNLRQMEEALDAFFRDHSERDALANLPALAQQAQGALTMLELPDAATLLGAAAALALPFASEGQPDEASQQKLADAFSSLGLFIEAYCAGRVDAERILRPVLVDFGVVEADETVDETPDDTVESGLPARREEVHAAYLDWRDQQDDAGKKKYLEALTELSRDAELIDDEKLLLQTRSASELCRDAAEAPLAMDQVIAEITGLLLPPRSAELAPLLDGADDANAPDLAPPTVSRIVDGHAAAASNADGVPLASAPDGASGLVFDAVHISLPEASGVGAASADADPVHAAIPDGVEAELLEIFLEEAHEVLAAVGDAAERCHANPDDTDALTIIRRGFHTLKGSGRMVGLTDLGETAWRLEQLLNSWLGEKKPATGDLLEVIAHARSVFQEWVDALQAAASVELPVAALLEAVDALAQGRSATGSAAVAPVARAGSTPEPSAEALIEPPAAVADGAVDMSIAFANTTDPAEIKPAAEPGATPVVTEATVGEAQSREANSTEDALEQDAATTDPEPELSQSDVTGSAERINHESTDSADSEVIAEIEAQPGTSGEAEAEAVVANAIPAEARADTTVAEAPTAMLDTGTAEAAPADRDTVLSTSADGEAEPHAEIGISRPLAPSPVLERDLAADVAVVPELDTEVAAALEVGALIEYAVAPEPVAHEAVADEICIGPVCLSTSLYEIFVVEARQRMTVLQEESSRHADVANSTVTEHARRAVHTLGGIAGTAGIMALADLSHALEQYWNRFVYAPLPASHLSLVESTVARLDEMVSTIENGALPEAASDLIATLGELGDAQVGADAAAESEAPAALSEGDAGSPDPTISNSPAEPTVPGEAEVVEQASPSPTGTLDVSALVSEIRPNMLAPVFERREVVDEIDDQLLPIFIEEAETLVPETSAHLRAWKAAPDSVSARDGLRRNLHTIKGSARMVGAMRLGELTHVMESRVIAVIEGQLAAGIAVFDTLEAQLDRVADSVERLKQGDLAPLPDDVVPMASPLEPVLSLREEAEALRAPGGAPATTSQPVTRDNAGLTLRVRADWVDRMVNQAGEVAIARSRIESEVFAFKRHVNELSDALTRLRGHIREVEIQAESQMQANFQTPGAAEQFDPLEFDRFTRFQEVTRFLAESVNDISTVQHILLARLGEADAALIQQTRLNRELQQNLLRVRMVPLNSVADRLYRTVRQTARDVEKRAQLDIQGGDLEIDRSVLEKVTAPLEHLLRNALAHGVETPEQRRAAGKTEFGEIVLSARQSGNEMMLTVSDDGAGLNYERIREKAEANGLMPPGVEPTETLLAQMIFAAGFTTAEEVSQVAGRGVGMDVVKSEIAALGGRIDIASTAGAGTSFHIYLPLTLAMTQAVMVQAAKHDYALPTPLVQQVLELKPAELEQAMMSGEVSWRGARYPFSYLPHLLGDTEALHEVQRYNPVVLLQSGLSQAAVLVDAIEGTREIVVKNIGPQMARITGVVGATVRGDGRVILIMNPVPLALRWASMPRVAPEARTPAATAEVSAALQAPMVLVVDDSLTVRKITTRLLTREGFRVDSAKDGVDALEKMNDLIPDVVLLDVEMPRMDGFELARVMRSDARLKTVPIIMITSRTADKHRNHATEIGVNVYLGKPYQEQQLLDSIAEQLEQAVVAD